VFHAFVSNRVSQWSTTLPADGRFIPISMFWGIFSESSYACFAALLYLVGSRQDVLEMRRYYEASTDPELIARCEARLRGALDMPMVKRTNGDAGVVKYGDGGDAFA
jgi:hypothetical protein